MAKPKDEIMPVIGWYQPHDRSSDYDGRVLDPKTGELVYLPSMTKQSEMAACDINNIVREFSLTGQVQHISAKAAQGAFLDLPTRLDYQESLNAIIAAEAAFMALPAKVRNRFDNDPGKFLEFFTDPANQDEAIAMGLATDTRPPAPSEPPVPPTPPGDAPKA